MNNMKVNFFVNNYLNFIENSYSVNDFLKDVLEISNRLLHFLIVNNLVFLNGKPCDTRTFINLDDSISIDFGYLEDNSNIVPCKMDLDIQYEDSWLLIVNKPSGVAIHPSILHYDDSLSNGVKYYFDKIGLKKKIRPVNRLDFNTSGLVIFAKCSYIHENLSKQMQNGEFSKMYLALVKGNLNKKQGVINLPIGRKDGSIIERCIDFKNGQNAITKYEVLKFFENKNCSLVKCQLITGRTHQIRVHFSAISHPLIGDSLYNDDFKNLNDNNNGQMLHCYFLKFKHPFK